MKIYIIAGEDSGDKLGSAIIDGLREATDVPPKFVGIGGNSMISRGLEPIFPMSELSVMGFVEIASHYKNLKNRLNQTCLLYTSPSPRDGLLSRMPSSA